MSITNVLCWYCHKPEDQEQAHGCRCDFKSLAKQLQARVENTRAEYVRLEADLRTERMRREALSREALGLAKKNNELALERDGMALVIRKVSSLLTTKRESPQWTIVDFDYMVRNVRAALAVSDYKAILDDHDNQVRRTPAKLTRL